MGWGREPSNKVIQTTKEMHSILTEIKKLSELRTQHSLQEDVGLNPSLNQWVKDPVLRQAAV